MIQDQIKNDTIEAMKAKDTLVLSVLRGLSSEIKNYEINELRASGAELTEADVIKVLQKEAKKRRESIAVFTEAGRTDLSEKEIAELGILEKYLPTQMSREDVEKIVAEVLSGMGKNPQFGDVMKAVMPKLGGQADGKVVSEVVKSSLG